MAETDNLFYAIDSVTLTDFNTQGTLLIKQGYEPLGSMTTYNIGANVHFLQTFWRRAGAVSFMERTRPQ